MKNLILICAGIVDLLANIPYIMDSFKGKTKPNIASWSGPGPGINVDVLAVLPTFKHAYLYPQEETWTTYLIAGCAAFVTVILASSLSFASLAIPLDFFLVNSMLAAIILFKRKKQINLS